MATNLKNIIWTPERIEELKKLWAQYRDWRKISKTMGINYYRCVAAYSKYVNAEERIMGSHLKYWTEERIREFCELWANEPDLQKILERFPEKDIWTLRGKARELKVKRLAEIGMEGIK